MAPFHDDAPLDRLRFAVLGVQTTGYRTEHHQLVELAVVHVDAGSPRLVFDSVLRPARRVGLREVHGLGNRDTRPAPPLADVAGAVADALTDRVLVADHVAFALGFVAHQLGPLGLRVPLPSVCTWRLPQALGVPTAPVDAGVLVARQQALRTSEHLRALLGSLEPGTTLKGLHQAAPAAVEIAAPLTADEASTVAGRRAPMPRPPLSGSDRPADPVAYVELLGAHLGEPPPPWVLQELRHLAGPFSRETLAAKHARTFGRWLVAESVSGALHPPQRQRTRRAVELLAALGWAPGYGD